MSKTEEKQLCENCLYWALQPNSNDIGICQIERIFAPNTHSQLGGKLFTDYNFGCTQFTPSEEYAKVLILPTRNTENEKGKLSNQSEGKASLTKPPTKRLATSEPTNPFPAQASD